MLIPMQRSTVGRIIRRAELGALCLLLVMAVVDAVLGDWGSVVLAVSVSVVVLGTRQLSSRLRRP